MLTLEQIINTKSYEIEVEAPASGPFVAHGAIENTAPDFLLGPGLSYAIKCANIGTHNKLYTYFADGSNIPADSKVTLRPAASTDLVPKLLILGSITDRIDELVPTIFTETGEEIKGTWDFQSDDEFSSDAQLAMRATFISETYGFRFRYIFPSVSPLPIIEGIGFRLDRQAEEVATFRFQFGEEVIWAKGDPVTSKFTLDSVDSFSMSVRVPMNGQFPIEIGLAAVSVIDKLTQTDDAAEIDPETPVEEQLRQRDIRNLEQPLGGLFDKAINNVAAHGGRFYFKRTSWDARFLGATIDTNRQNLRRSNASIWRENMFRPYDSAIHPSQAGSQDSFGVSFYAPIWSSEGASVLHKAVVNAYAWLDRPSVVFDPDNLGFPIVPDNLPKEAMTEHRQFYNDKTWNPEDVFPGQNVPHMGAPDPISGRFTPNQTHLADMPLFAAYALTGNFALQCQIEYQNSMDLRQKEVFMSWVGNSREEGRTVRTMLTAGMLRPHLWDANVTWCKKRLDNVISDAYHQSPEVKMYAIRPIHWANLDGNANSPWENAQLADGFMRLYGATGDLKYALWAHRTSRPIGYSSILRNGQYIIPYVYKVLENKADYYFSPEDRWNKRDFYAFSETATNWIFWSGCGIRAHLEATMALIGTEHQSEIEMHLEATEMCYHMAEWLDTILPGSISDLHLSNWQPTRMVSQLPT